ncbi:leucine-rich repeat and transmembrane domain-containing protein 2-like [Carcharodon carcharias]|uniref:leucine-rich repeat and transmembrane domain-containing protein 2-like n=1 Tax=Carcharodon carcharias TaxID=13397 RepID=UPI001B7D9528|nr:leucine-rich repeat and transmembrane domain-containing protein 2-like [Carcharodon carcharias]
MLIMDNNLLSTINAASFEGLGNLQELYMRNNGLGKLPKDIFKHTPKLTQLALSGNKLKSIDVTSFSQLPGLREVFLHGNPWSCDCRMKTFLHWLSQSKANLSPFGTLRCVTPHRNKGRTLNSLKVLDLQCKARGL